MRKNRNLIVIENDVFDIAKRIKEIDNRYFIVYDSKSKKFQLHQNNGGQDSYVLTFPFAYLDARAITYTQKTRVSRLDQIVKEINKNNSDIEYRETKKARNEISAQLDAFFH